MVAAASYGRGTFWVCRLGGERRVVCGGSAALAAASCGDGGGGGRGGGGCGGGRGGGVVGDVPPRAALPSGAVWRRWGTCRRPFRRPASGAEATQGMRTPWRVGAAVAVAAAARGVACPALATSSAQRDAFPAPLFQQRRRPSGTPPRAQQPLLRPLLPSTGGRGRSHLCGRPPRWATPSRRRRLAAAAARREVHDGG